MAISPIEAERIRAFKIRALRNIQIEIGRMKRNYPDNSPESEVFERVARLLFIVYNIYNGEEE